jgi:hypothetical protein
MSRGRGLRLGRFAVQLRQPDGYVRSVSLGNRYQAQ